MSSTKEFASVDGLKPVAGVRRITPAGLAAHRAARDYAVDRTLAVKRIEASQLAKRAADALGLKAAKIAMIDKLFGYSPATDWNSKDANPIVWPSNEALARQLGLSISTARHHLRGLAAAGLIAHASHPTFQRRGVRDRQGKIVEAFGIDLAPIITRYDELHEIALAYEREGRERRTLSYQRTQVRREVEAVLVAAQRDGLVGTWLHFYARLDRLREREPSDLGQFRELIEALTVLREDVEEAYRRASLRSNLDTAVALPKRTDLLQATHPPTMVRSPTPARTSGGLFSEAETGSCELAGLCLRLPTRRAAASQFIHRARASLSRLSSGPHQLVRLGGAGARACAQRMPPGPGAARGISISPNRASRRHLLDSARSGGSTDDGTICGEGRPRAGAGHLCDRHCIELALGRRRRRRAGIAKNSRRQSANL